MSYDSVKYEDEIYNQFWDYYDYKKDSALFQNIDLGNLLDFFFDYLEDYKYNDPDKELSDDFDDYYL